MSEDVDKIIEDALGVVDDTPKEMVVKPKSDPIPIPKSGTDIDKDYKFQRRR